MSLITEQLTPKQLFGKAIKKKSLEDRLDELMIRIDEIEEYVQDDGRCNREIKWALRNYTGERLRKSVEMARRKHKEFLEETKAERKLLAELKEEFDDLNCQRDVRDYMRELIREREEEEEEPEKPESKSEEEDSDDNWIETDVYLRMRYV